MTNYQSYNWFVLVQRPCVAANPPSMSWELWETLLLVKVRACLEFEFQKWNLQNICAHQCTQFFWLQKKSHIQIFIIYKGKGVTFFILEKWSHIRIFIIFNQNGIIFCTSEIHDLSEGLFKYLGNNVI